MSVDVGYPRPFENLCGAYFNADWDLDGPNGRAMIALFVNGSSAESVRDAHAEGVDLLSLETETQLRAALEDRGLQFYDPSVDGMTYRQWLELVVAMTATPAD